MKRWAGSVARSTPSNASVPDVTGSRPAIALISVVLPAPFGPTTHTSSPAATESETPVERAAPAP